MKNLFSTYWQILEGRYKSLKSRERQMVAACVLLLPAYLLNSLVYEPAQQQQKRAAVAADTARRTVDALAADMSSLQLQLQQSPDAPLEAEKTRMRALEARADTALSTMSRALVSPSEMNDVLKNVLGSTPGLRLIRLTTLPPESVLPDSGTKALEPAEHRFDLYKHGVEISIEGRYTDLQNYVLQLESQEKQLLWDRLHFKVDHYPLSILTLQVHTLSVDKAWLSL